jgi:hypothetical protein
MISAPALSNERTAMNDDDYDDYEEELSPTLAAQLERLAQNQSLKIGQSGLRQKARLKVRRQLEDWKDSRRIRDEIDYLS